MPKVDLDDPTAARLLQLLRDYQDAVDLLTTQNQQLRLENQRLSTVIVDELKVLGVAIRQSLQPLPLTVTVDVPVGAVIPATGEAIHLAAAHVPLPAFMPRVCKRCQELFIPLTKYNRSCPACKARVFGNNARHLEKFRQGQRTEPQTRKKPLDKPDLTN